MFAAGKGSFLRVMKREELVEVSITDSCPEITSHFSFKLNSVEMTHSCHNALYLHKLRSTIYVAQQLVT